MAKLTSLSHRLAVLDLRIATPTSGQPIGQDRQSQRRRYDQERETFRLSRQWYNSSRWRALRMQQLTRNPLCDYCKAEGRVGAATICDHAEPHREDEIKFWSGPFQSLCKHHHDGQKQREEQRRA